MSYSALFSRYLIFAGCSVDFFPRFDLWNPVQRMKRGFYILSKYCICYINNIFYKSINVFHVIHLLSLSRQEG